MVAPSLIPTKPGDRAKTDRRDSESLARLHRAGELTAVWVPGPEQEAVRDLTRAREDIKALERQAKQRLSAFLLRHGRLCAAGKTKWTKAHSQWLMTLKFEALRAVTVFDGAFFTIGDGPAAQVIVTVLPPRPVCRIRTAGRSVAA